MKKSIFRIILLLISELTLIIGFIPTTYAEPVCHFTHYSTENGLPQYTIMDILQDKNGFMWFGTWDGLSRFDGYRFQNFKVHPGDSFYMKSNRIEKLYEDKYGRIWFRTYDKEIHCFDANQNIFRDVQITQNDLKQEFCANAVEIKASGKVWLLSPDNGCVEVTDSLFSVKHYSNKKISATKVYSILEDNKKETWLLTDNGLRRLDRSGTIHSYFNENTDTNQQEWQSFYSGVETEKYIFFLSENGRIWRYAKANGKFQLIQSPYYGALIKCLKVNNNRIVIISQNEGFLLYKTDNNEFIPYNSITNKTLTSNQVNETFLIDSRYFWFTSSDAGIFRLDIDKSIIKHFKVTINDLSILAFPPDAFVFKDIEGRTWVHPKGGGFGLLNNATDEIDPFYNDRKSPNWRFSNVIHSACSDFQGNLWLCTRSRGLEKIVFDKNFFRKSRINNKEINDIANEVRMILEDNEKNTWISTKDGRLTIFDKNKQQIGRLNVNGKIVPDAVLPAVVYCALIDNHKNIWLGTRGDGIYKLSKITALNYAVEHFKKTRTIYTA